MRWKTSHIPAGMRGHSATYYLLFCQLQKYNSDDSYSDDSYRDEPKHPYSDMYFFAKNSAKNYFIAKSL